MLLFESFIDLIYTAGFLPCSSQKFRAVKFKVPVETMFDSKANSAFHPYGSVNEYQLRLGMRRQAWFIPLADVLCAGKL